MKAHLGKRFLHLSLIAWFCFLPLTVCANSGTPLIWLSSCHLFIGNFFIAALEAALLTRRPNVRPAGTRFLLFLFANYLTMFVGGFLLGSGTFISSLWMDYKIGNELYHGLLLLLIIFTYPITILLESPFCYFLIAKGSRTAGRALRYSLLVNTVSYAFLAILYLLAADHQFLFMTDMAPREEIARSPVGDLYFIGPNGVVRSSTTGGEEQVVWRGDAARLNLQYNKDSAVYDLVAFSDWGSSSTIILEDVADFAGERSGRVSEDDTNAGHYFPDLRTKNEVAASKLTMGPGFSREERTISTESRRIRLESPLSHHHITNATILPNELIVFEMRSGRGSRIMLLDTNAMRMAQLTKGSHPVVAYRRDAFADDQ